MAFKAGRSAQILFNEYDVSSYLNSAGVQIGAETADTTTFASNGWKEAMATLLSGTFPFQGFHDVALPVTAQLGVDAGTLTYAPAGATAIGDAIFMAPITSTGLQKSSAVGGVVAISWTAMAEGAVAYGQMLHPLAEDTNTTTGSSKDDGASSSTGWTAHLHVTARDAGSWVIKLQDSADNSSWADVTGGAFTAATGATSQRLVSASAASTLRRYVRYVATRTGGSAGDGITFALGYARSNQ